ncbi:Txe/YoeB family addiction module toxin [Rugamonas sp. DEMB1]|uniref:Txe/YoeB family addiction module toxin n=1 Tax=Rugamonas sp. DEMB1 TaxID=3039386 RepID=UPI00244C0884|nr:Txe/YoeB family addiction module toxin [Rugamonas sp. DEMB1]WGG50362.1 Txe/YoeB family addiction module toxin [Rugamonas sp. DEMB1]
MKNSKTKNKEQAKQSSVSFTEIAWEDYQYWQKEDPKLVERINDLIDECMSNPFKGTGKPEPLKGNLTGLWSRRIDREHRLLYVAEGGTIYIVGCRYHY